MRLGTYFTLAELCVTQQKSVDNTPDSIELRSLRLLVRHILDPLRANLGRPVIVTSGFRSELVNNLVGGASGSQHTQGQAADIHVVGMTSDQLAQAIIVLGLPYDQVIEEYGRWVHVSYGPRHRRQALRATRTTQGGTRYTPFEEGR